MQKKNIQRVAPKKMATMVETIFGCKWSLTVYSLLRQDIIRAGEMVRSVDGLTTKVLNQCLRRNVEFGILQKNIFPEVPPRVEYEVTAFGEKFLQIVDAIELLDQQLHND